jgi:hypothetical protein
MSLYPELDNLTERYSLAELIDLFWKPAPEHIESIFYYDSVVIAIREKGKAGNRFLVKALKQVDECDEDRISMLLVALSSNHMIRGVEPLAYSQRKTVREYTVECLNDARPYIVQTAISALQHLRIKDVIDQIMPLRNHAHPSVRGATLRYVQACYPKIAFPILIEALQDPYEYVREEATDQLFYLGNPDAITYIEPLINDLDEHVRAAAQETIRWLTEVKSWEI